VRKELASRSSSTALGHTPTTSLRHLSTGALRRAGFDEFTHLDRGPPLWIGRSLLVPGVRTLLGVCRHLGED
jgi:hypothetical protein